VNYNVKGFHFKETCGACPEQYDVTNGRGEPVAYVRLRFGRLTASVPNASGQVIYEHAFEDSWLGTFDDDATRHLHLMAIAKILKRRARRERRDQEMS
jgi:hypothetical protein